MDDYDCEAVYTPAIINLIILEFVFTCTLLPVVENTVWWFATTTLISLAAATLLTRFIMHFFRAVSRVIFEDLLYRKDRLNFPTTSMLLIGDHSISQTMKQRIRDDLKTQYNMTLFTKSKETADEMEARRTAKDAVALIRKTVSASKDITTHRKLKRYGMFRNFLGGAVFCFPLSVTCWAIDFSHTGTSNTIILTVLILYLLLIMIDFLITKNAAMDYAETLITTFDKLNHNEA